MLLSDRFNNSSSTKKISHPSQSSTPSSAMASSHKNTAESLTDDTKDTSTELSDSEDRCLRKASSDSWTNIRSRLRPRGQHSRISYADYDSSSLGDDDEQHVGKPDEHASASNASTPENGSSDTSEDIPLAIASKRSTKPCLIPMTADEAQSIHKSRREHILARSQNGRQLELADWENSESISCLFCTHSPFSRASDCKRHMRSSCLYNSFLGSSTPADRSPRFTCDLCGIPMSRMDALKRHQRRKCPMRTNTSIAGEKDDSTDDSQASVEGVNSSEADRDNENRSDDVTSVDATGYAGEGEADDVEMLDGEGGQGLEDGNDCCGDDGEENDDDDEGAGEADDVDMFEEEDEEDKKGDENEDSKHSQMVALDWRNSSSSFCLFCPDRPLFPSSTVCQGHMRESCRWNPASDISRWMTTRTDPSPPPPLQAYSIAALAKVARMILGVDKFRSTSNPPSSSQPVSRNDAIPQPTLTPINTRIDLAHVSAPAPSTHASAYGARASQTLATGVDISRLPVGSISRQISYDTESLHLHRESGSSPRLQNYDYVHRAPVTDAFSGHQVPTVHQPGHMPRTDMDRTHYLSQGTASGATDQHRHISLPSAQDLYRPNYPGITSFPRDTYRRKNYYGDPQPAPPTSAHQQATFPDYFESNTAQQSLSASSICLPSYTSVSPSPDRQFHVSWYSTAPAQAPYTPARFHEYGNHVPGDAAPGLGRAAPPHPEYDALPQGHMPTRPGPAAPTTGYFAPPVSYVMPASGHALPTQRYADQTNPSMWTRGESINGMATSQRWDERWEAVGGSGGNAQTDVPRYSNGEGGTFLLPTPAVFETENGGYFFHTLVSFFIVSRQAAKLTGTVTFSSRASWPF